MSQLEFTPEELKALKAEFCKGFNDEQATVALTFSRVRNLIPGKHVLFSLRRSKEWDELVGAKVEVTKIVFMTTIDAARLIALRSKEYNGQEPETYIYLDENGSPSIESKIPLPQTPLPPPGTTALPREPWAVRTTVYRKGFDHPMTSVARFDAYASTYKTQNGPQLTEMWAKRGPEQLAKCSEMLSLRKAFPEELGSLYIAEEFKAEAEENRPPVVTPASVVPQPPQAPPVNQTPAVPTEAPRPNEVKMPPVLGGRVVTLVPGGATVLQDSSMSIEVEKIETPIQDAKAAAVAAVPSLKPASELPTPKKRGPKPKSPDNGRNIPAEGGITQADINNVESTPAPQIDVAASKAEAEQFVSSLDPTPTKEEMVGFTARVRALTAAGAVSLDLKNYILAHGKKQDTKQLTVADWMGALSQLEAAQAAGTLKEVTKNVPLPAF